MTDTAEFNRLDTAMRHISEDMQQVKIGIARIEQRMTDQAPNCIRQEAAVKDLYEKRDADHRSIIKVFVTAIVGLLTAVGAVIATTFFKGS